VLWVAGLATVLIDLAKGYRASRQLVSASLPFSHVGIVELARQLGIRAPRVLKSDVPGLPFAAGIFRPVVVIPAEECEANVYAHELAHIRSRDLFWSLFARLTLGIFWFCPFIHKLEAELSLWQEARADQSACQITNCPVKEHAAAIVRSVAPRGSNLVWDACLSGNGRLIKRRLSALYQGRGSKAVAVAMGAILIIGLTPWKLTLPSESFSPTRARMTGPPVAEIAAIISR